VPEENVNREGDELAAVAGDMPKGVLEQLEAAELGKRIREAVETSKLGAYDGAHHKDWVIQQMVKTLNGWDERTLKAWLWRQGWEEGIAP
jgi:hypothetical protein